MRKFEYSKFSTKGWTAYLHWPESSPGAKTMVLEDTDGYTSIAVNLSDTLSASWQRDEITKHEFDEAFTKAIKVIRDNHKE